MKDFIIIIKEINYLVFDRVAGNNLSPSTYNEIKFPGEDARPGISTWQTDFPEALFDLDTDVRELNNRLDDYPEKASFLKNQLTLFQKILDKEARPIGEMER